MSEDAETRRARRIAQARQITEQHKGALGKLAWHEGFEAGYAAAREQAAAKCSWFASVQCPPNTGYLEGRRDAGLALEGHIRAMQPEKDPAP